MVAMAISTYRHHAGKRSGSSQCDSMLEAVELMDIYGCGGSTGPDSASIGCSITGNCSVVHSSPTGIPSTGIPSIGTPSIGTSSIEPDS
jgi:hypothetical protein